MRSRILRVGLLALLFGGTKLVAGCSATPATPSATSGASGVSATLRHYLEAHPGERVPVSVFYDFRWPDGLGDLLSDSNERVRSRAQADLRKAVEQQGNALRGQVEAKGIGVVEVGTAFPAIFIEATAAQLGAIETLPRVGRLRLNVPPRGGPLDAPLSGPPNSMSTIGIDSEFNNLGYYGLNQGIGFIEGGQCGIYDSHQAFGYSSPFSAGRVTYDGPIDACDPINYAQQCASCSFLGASGAGKDFLCVNGQCVGTHATWVMSSAAASTDAMYGAAQANLFYGNNGTGSGLVACTDQAVINEYTWFVSAGAVTTVNESWACQFDGDPSVEKDSDGPIQDWFARNYQLTVVRAAGDLEGNPPVACAFIHNAICVGGYDPNTGQVATGSSWVNPYLHCEPDPAGGCSLPPGNFTNIPTSVCDYTSSTTDYGKKCGDREEPDVLALSVNVDTAGVDYPATNLWGTQIGTSQAAPAVAAAVALTKQACADTLGYGSIVEAKMRAMIRTAAYLQPSLGYWTIPLEPPACAPGSACDGKSGAGLVNSASLLDFCGINMTTNGVFEYSGRMNPGRALLQNTPALPSGKYGGAPYGQLAHLGQINANWTVRATLSWDICASQDKASESVLDYDLFLFNNTTHQYVTMQPSGKPTFSATYDDNNEGFQVLITDPGDYSFMISVLHTGALCPGTSSEPYYVEATYGINF